jgi:hypothetical protein
VGRNEGRAGLFAGGAEKGRAHSAAGVSGERGRDEGTGGVEFRRIMATNEARVAPIK